MMKLFESMKKVRIGLRNPTKLCLRKIKIMLTKCSIRVRFNLLRELCVLK